MYYGRTWMISPVYVKTRCKRSAPQVAQAQASGQCAGIRRWTARAKYKKHNELDKAVKDENDARLLDMANLIGGFVCVKDIQAVQKLFLEENTAFSKERVKEMNRRSAVQLPIWTTCSLTSRRPGERQEHERPQEQGGGQAAC